MGRDKNLMAALANVREELGEEIAGLGRSLDDSRREVLERIDTETAELRADGRETRDRAHRGATAAAETGRAVSQLRQEISEVRDAIAGLRRTLDTLAQHPVFRTEPTEAQGPLGEEADPGWAGLEPETVDAGQEPPFPPLAEGGGHEPGHHGHAVPGDPPAVAPFEDAGGEPGAEDEDGIGQGEDRIRSETQEDIDHGVLLLKAAKAGTVALVCHRESWEFFTACAADNEHFRGSCELTDQGDGRVRAVLSGRSLIGALISLRHTRDESHLDGTWALTSAFYSRIAEGLRRTTSGGRQPLTVVFDDGVRDEEPGASGA
ncbi:hypothetical protein CP973_19500 [Streptomyces albofaciens JCM 4342]|uniref:hypothetical protein n=1 Tax=Streptomyces albofaciens TaxID=66866 RepID=UPI00123B38D8|nr:hypothetical protein [Streptomyces albofaciens]KAA6223816.1 hypothetical protein CP973_19500 [Streptomyces albofaciens JCM 4342]